MNVRGSDCQPLMPTLGYTYNLIGPWGSLPHLQLPRDGPSPSSVLPVYHTPLGPSSRNIRGLPSVVIQSCRPGIQDPPQPVPTRLPPIFLCPCNVSKFFGG